MHPPRSRTDQDLAAARRVLDAQDSRPELGRIARLAARLLGVASAQVSLLTDVQTIAAGAGLPAEVLDSVTPLSESLCTVTATCGGSLMVPDARADPRVSSLPPVVSGAVGSYLGVPLMIDDGAVVGALCVFDGSPRAWSDADAALLEQLAESAAAELELAALSGEFATSRARWELAIDAAGIGSFELDVVTGQLACDGPMLAMFGWDAADVPTIEAFRERVYPDDRVRVVEALQDAVDHAGTYTAEHRILLPSGEVRWIDARGRALADATGKTVRLAGAASDTTALRASEAGVVRVLESMSAAFLAVDRAWNVTYANAEAERLLRASRDALVGRELWALFPALAGSPFEAMYRDAMAGRPGSIEAYYPAPLQAWFEVRASPAPDGLSLYFLDVTTRRTGQDLAELSARVGQQISGALDVEDAATRLAEAVVPRLADWSLVSLTDADGAMRDVAGWHADPAMRPVLDRLVADRLPATGDRGAVSEALRTAAPVVIPSGATAVALGIITAPAAIVAITELAPESAVVLPLSARGHLIGVLSLCRGPGRVPMTDHEMPIAASVAARAALAIDNIRLYADQRSTTEQLREANRRLRAVAAHDRTVARALQDSMLTRLPEPDHLHLVARYLTATGTEQVGGDWYDALVLPGGATTVVIGDVSGHDINAAAAMGQLRSMLRAFAWDHPEDTPSTVVNRLDRAARELSLSTLATLVLLQVEQGPVDRAHGMRELRWTNAGHPPPIVVHTDGTATVLDTTNDLLLGASPGVPRHDHTHSAPPGSTLILYTDGLIETRTADIDAGQARLLDSLRTHHRLAPGELLDAVLADMVGSQPDDDVAILAVRFHPEDADRPAEAGPRRD